MNQVISVRLLITTAFSFTFTIGGIYDELKKWLGKDVVLILKNGQEKTGTLKGPVIDSEMIEDEVRLLNGIFVTHIKIKDIVEIKDAF